MEITRHLENLVSVDGSALPETTRQWKYHEKLVPTGLPD